jgi:hypothetical protein
VKFKVWDDKKKMFLDRGWPFYIGQTGRLCFHHNGRVDKADDWLIPVLSTEEQDVDGEELFDGDIVSNGIITGTIVFNDSGWGIDFGYVVMPFGKNYNKALRKIGSKFENPELLKPE